MAAMKNEPDWGRRGVIAAWVLGVPTLVVAVLTYVRPPDPAHPMSLDFLSQSITLPSWLAAILTFAISVVTVIVVKYYDRNNLPSPPGPPLSNPLQIPFEFHGTSLDERATSPTIYYIAKLRLSLENKGTQVIHVLPPRWTMAVGNVSVQCGAAIYPSVPYKPVMLEFGYGYQIEQSIGSWRQDKWKLRPDGKPDEPKDIYVEPGWTFRIWIGLNPMVPHDVLEKRRKTAQLGTLTLPMVIGDREADWQREI